jgi:hypothetical protein
VKKTAGSVSVPLVRSGGDTLPVKVSYYDIRPNRSQFQLRVHLRHRQLWLPEVPVDLANLASVDHLKF